MLFVTMNHETVQHNGPPSILTMLPISVGISALLLTITTYSVLAFEATAPALAVFCIWPLFVVVTLASLIYVPRHWRKNAKRATLPLLVNSIGAVITFGVLTLSQSIDLDFRLHVNGFNEVIGLVEAGDLHADAQGNIDLPSQYKYLSEGGAIRTHSEDDITSILFYGSKGILGEFWGYAYRSNNSPPTDFLWCDAWLPLRQPRFNWFMCESY